MKILGLRFNQVAFLLAALGILVSLPWFSSWGAWIWVGSLVLLLAGVVLVLKGK